MSQLHPWLQQPEIVQYCISKGIVIEAYCPLVRNAKAEDPTLVGIAKKHGKTASQVLVRYSMARGWVPLPKSDTPEFIVSNFDVEGLALDKEDMEKLNSLDQGPKGALVEAVENHTTGRR